MSTIAFDQFALTRIADFARTPSRLHQVAPAGDRRRPDRPRIQRGLHVDLGLHHRRHQRRSVLDRGPRLSGLLDEAHARIFAGEQGYDLVDDQGMLTDWWGFCWMILAEKRGLLTVENRALLRARRSRKNTSPRRM
jgi:hypothetical protein